MISSFDVIVLSCAAQGQSTLEQRVASIISVSVPGVYSPATVPSGLVQTPRQPSRLAGPRGHPAAARIAKPAQAGWKACHQPGFKPASHAGEGFSPQRGQPPMSLSTTLHQPCHGTFRVDTAQRGARASVRENRTFFLSGVVGRLCYTAARAATGGNCAEQDPT
jgi:hypothetical protein